MEPHCQKLTQKNACPFDLLVADRVKLVVPAVNDEFVVHVARWVLLSIVWRKPIDAVLRNMHLFSPDPLCGR